MPEDIKTLIECLREGKTILAPTDTGWGYLCDAANEEAVKLLIENCNADISQLVVLFDSPSRLQTYLNEMPDIVWDLTEMSTTPLTLRLQNARNLASLLTTEEYCSFRVVTADFINTLCTRMRRPLACIHIGKQKPIYSMLSESFVAGMADVQEPVFSNESIIELGDGNLFRIIKQ